MLLLSNNNRVRKRPLNRTYTLKDIVKDYIILYNSDLEQSTISNICRDFNKAIIKSIIEEGTVLNLPRMGKFFLIQKHTTENSAGERTNVKLKIDFNETRKQGKIIYHKNEHSLGYYYCFKWLRSTKGAENTFKYLYKSTKTNKRYLAKCAKNGNVKVSLNL
jgi:hypothetical protein